MSSHADESGTYAALFGASAAAPEAPLSPYQGWLSPMAADANAESDELLLDLEGAAAAWPGTEMHNQPLSPPISPSYSPPSPMAAAAAGTAAGAAGAASAAAAAFSAPTEEAMHFPMGDEPLWLSAAQTSFSLHAEAGDGSAGSAAAANASSSSSSSHTGSASNGDSSSSRFRWLGGGGRSTNQRWDKFKRGRKRPPGSFHDGPDPGSEQDRLQQQRQAQGQGQGQASETEGAARAEKRVRKDDDNPAPSVSLSSLGRQLDDERIIALSTTRLLGCLELPLGSRSSHLRLQDMNESMWMLADLSVANKKGQTGAALLLKYLVSIPSLTGFDQVHVPTTAGHGFYGAHRTELRHFNDMAMKSVLAIKHLMVRALLRYKLPDDEVAASTAGAGGGGGDAAAASSSQTKTGGSGVVGAGDGTLKRTEVALDLWGSFRWSSSKFTGGNGFSNSFRSMATGMTRRMVSLPECQARPRDAWQLLVLFVAELATVCKNDGMIDLVHCMLDALDCSHYRDAYPAMRVNGQTLLSLYCMASALDMRAFSIVRRLLPRTRGTEAHPSRWHDQQTNNNGGTCLLGMVARIFEQQCQLDSRHGLAGNALTHGEPLGGPDFTPIRPLLHLLLSEDADLVTEHCPTSGQDRHFYSVLSTWPALLSEVRRFHERCPEHATMVERTHELALLPHRLVQSGRPQALRILFRMLDEQEGFKCSSHGHAGGDDRHPDNRNPNRHPHYARRGDGEEAETQAFAGLRVNPSLRDDDGRTLLQLLDNESYRATLQGGQEPARWAILRAHLVQLQSVWTHKERPFVLRVVAEVTQLAPHLPELIMSFLDGKEEEPKPRPSQRALALQQQQQQSKQQQQQQQDADSFMMDDREQEALQTLADGAMAAAAAAGAAGAEV